MIPDSEPGRLREPWGALAERCEAVSRELDCLIADAVGAWPAGWVKHLPGMDGAPWAYHNPDATRAEWMEAPAYTASLDAAMTLAVNKPGCGFLWLEDGIKAFDGIHVGKAATPALAMTAAALRARASQVEP